MPFEEDQFRTYVDLVDPPKLFYQEVMTSTNTILWDLLANGAPMGSVAIAAQQSGGRGQWGRTWVSSAGGLYLSMAIAPNLIATQSARLTLASAWGIATLFRQQQILVQLKWPNDLYLCGKKLGGILTETSVQQSRIHRAVVGVGINWANNTPDNAIALKDTQLQSPISSLEALAALVVNGILEGQRSLQEFGLTQIIPDYRRWLFQPLPQGLSWDDL